MSVILNPITPEKVLEQGFLKAPRQEKAKKQKYIRHQGRQGKEKAAANKEALKLYFDLHGNKASKFDDSLAPCQSCTDVCFPKEMDAHHKLERGGKGGRSGGSNEPENYLATCCRCHAFIHQNKPDDQRRVGLVRSQYPNVVKGGFISWQKEDRDALQKYHFTLR